MFFRNIWSTAKRELVSETASPAAWVFLVIFLVTASLCAFVASGMFASGQADLSPFFDWMPWLFLLIVPALTMPMWSEERRTGVFELTLSFPASLPELVLGKFLAGTLLLAAALFLTFPIPLTALVLGKPDMGAVFCGYAGALMLGMVYLAIGSFASALSRSQTAGFLLASVICGFFLFLGWPPLTEFAAGWIPFEFLSLLSALSFLPNYQAFQKGIMDTSEIIYAFSLTGFFLALTGISLKIAASGTGSLFAPGALKNPGLRKTLFVAGEHVLLALVLCLSLIIVAGNWRLRFDVSGDRAYSIAKASKKIARTLPREVYIRFYASTGSAAMNQPLKKYARRVEWLIREFVSASAGKIHLDCIDPGADSPEEEAALLEGLKPITDPAGNRVYLGFSVSRGEKIASVPVLSPRNESMLEYEIARALTAVSREQAPKIGVMSAFKITGATPDLAKIRQITGKIPAAEPAWYAISELKKDFEIVNISLDAAEIPGDIKALLIIHPNGIRQRTLYAIDRYVTGGGHLAVFLDPRSYYAVLKSRKDYSFVEKTESDLGPLPAAWGAAWNKDLMAVDMLTAYRKYLPGRMITIPAVMNLTPEQISGKYAVTSLLNSIGLYFSGFFVLSPRNGVKSETLLFTSPESQAVSAHIGDRSELVIRHFKPGSVSMPLGVHLSGLMPGAYPKVPDADWLKNGETHRTKGIKPAEIYLFADSDMLFNDVCIRAEQGILGNKEYVRTNDNITLLQNVMETLAGDGSLAGVRGRIPMSRPLTKINEMKAAAELRYRDRIMELERSFGQAASRLELLRREKRNSDEVRNETKKLTAVMQDARRELAALRNNLKTDLDRLENRIRFINLVAIPVLTALAGILWAILRRRRNSVRVRS